MFTSSEATITHKVRDWQGAELHSIYNLKRFRISPEMDPSAPDFFAKKVPVISFFLWVDATLSDEEAMVSWCRRGH